MTAFGESRRSGFKLELSSNYRLGNVRFAPESSRSGDTMLNDRL